MCLPTYMSEKNGVSIGRTRWKAQQKISKKDNEWGRDE